jgi:hypothetical protein
MATEHKALKAQIDAGLKKARESSAEQQRVAEGNIKVMSLDKVRNNMPWMRALAMEKELLAKQHKMSSVGTYFLCLMGISSLIFAAGVCNFERVPGIRISTSRHACKDI